MAYSDAKWSEVIKTYRGKMDITAIIRNFKYSSQFYCALMVSLVNGASCWRRRGFIEEMGNPHLH